MSGWIKLNRQLLEWEWYQDSNMVHLYTHMLMKANREPRKWKGMWIDAGQFVGGREMLSAETGLSVQCVRTCVKRLQECGFLTSQPTNRFTIFTLVKWGLHANGEDSINHQSNHPATIQQPTVNQPITTNKNIKKDKKEKNNTPYNPPMEGESHVISQKPPKAKAKRATQIPDKSFFDMQYPKEYQMDPDLAFEIFSDWAIAKGQRYVDWNLGWKKACRDWLPEKVVQAQANQSRANAASEERTLDPQWYEDWAAFHAGERGDTPPNKEDYYR